MQRTSKPVQIVIGAALYMALVEAESAVARAMREEERRGEY